jgi:hypothetical protein
MTERETPQIGKISAETETRRQREAEALRRNLQRRKAAARRSAPEGKKNVSD